MSFTAENLYLYKYIIYNIIIIGMLSLHANKQKFYFIVIIIIICVVSTEQQNTTLHYSIP